MKARENMLRNLDTFIERIEGLSRVQRILIYVGVFALVILVFGYLSYWPKYQNIGHLNADFNQSTAADIDFIPFQASKYGQSSYLLQVDDLLPGEYAITLDGSRDVFNMFGVD